MTNKKRSKKFETGIDVPAFLEAAVYVAAALLFVYGALLVFAMPAMNAFNDSGENPTYVLLGSLIPLALGINFIMQSVRLFREPTSVHNREKLLASLVILGIPVILFMIYAGLSSMFPLSAAMAKIVTVGVIVGVASATLAGATWLWKILLDPNKEVPKKPHRKHKKTQVQSKAQTAKRRKLGLQLILLPVILFAMIPALAIVLAVISANMHGAGDRLWVVLAIPQFVLRYIWLPSVIAGIVLLYKNPRNE